MAGPISWQLATVTAIRDETPTVRSFTLGVPAWGGHRPGQHVDLRLTAADGYSVERSYSIASEPERAGEVEITVERIADGEVSPFLHDVVVVGDRLELRGPIGGYFVWEAALGGPLLLVAGGSGVVPLMAMLRHRARAGIARPDAPAVQLAPPRGDHLSRRARPPGVERGRARGLPHADAVAATGLVGLRPPHRRAHAGGGARATRYLRTRLLLRTDVARRDGCERARPSRPAARSRPDRTLRPDRHLGEGGPADDRRSRRGPGPRRCPRRERLGGAAQRRCSAPT